MLIIGILTQDNKTCDMGLNRVKGFRGMDVGTFKLYMKNNSSEDGLGFRGWRIPSIYT